MGLLSSFILVACGTFTLKTGRGENGGNAMKRALTRPAAPRHLRLGSRTEAGQCLVPVAIGGSAAGRLITFASVICGWLPVDPLTRFEPTPNSHEETGQPSLFERQSHEPAQSLFTPGPAGLTVQPIVRLGVVEATRSLAGPADALVNAF